MLRNPTYLTKEETKVVFRQLDKGIRALKSKKRDYAYSAIMLKAMVHLLYATGLRNAELRNLRPSDIDVDGMRGVVIGKGGKQNNFTFNPQAKAALQDFLAAKEEFYKESTPHHRYLFATANF